MLKGVQREVLQFIYTFESSGLGGRVLIFRKRLPGLSRLENENQILLHQSSSSLVRRERRGIEAEARLEILRHVTFQL